MELGLFQKQTTNLVMTTELKQAIALLQYSTMELAQFIQEQALENPLIELEEKKQQSQVEETYDFSRRNSTRNNEPLSPLDFVAEEKGGLSESLLEQLQWLDISAKDRSILKFLIHSLDDNGYLTISSREAAQHLSIAEPIVERNIKKLQALEPIGVGSRDLKECLLLQLKAYYPEKELAAKVISDHLEMFAHKKWPELAQKLRVSLNDIKDVANCIQTLQPKPCIGIEYGPTRYMVPDITIVKENDEYIVSLNDHFLPGIRLNTTYKDMLSQSNETAHYFHEKYNHYKWLTRSIEQRRNTLLKIVDVLVNKQREFLDHGFYMLQPLTLKEIAYEIDMHESSVSRAVKNKVIQTPKGTFEMQRLFTSKLKKEDGGHTSSTKVKILIQTIIEQEDKQKPLSDQKIAEHLYNHNKIAISRRTVAKYREELNLLSSSKRKEFF
ncbi:RNA polymerase factor sigma-54 [Lederbergia sp. NSJ-179]|uniref:RNA polymerase factor sigma-54 n=1 Tax=Lederbergia sp. NSJ-179 TaxID=2931402 RepID=UPI001FD611F0|nr:RNA polymerase factor sigma-54 [Lederbergia sp. NSJ-179]MCJ7842377.1 RNA polymerase factor sigma-54 [Lederbergia sp. NSJ-179]